MKRHGLNKPCKYIGGRPNNPQTYKPDPVFLKGLIYKIKCIFLELCKDSELEKYLHGKIENANESSNGRIRVHIPKYPFATLRYLELGEYGAAANFNIRMKVSLLFYQKSSF